MWVGQTFLFTWMDRALNAEESLWMVHSGGFYVVERQKIPKVLPQKLHWFKWEAAVTRRSGMALPIRFYFSGGFVEAEGEGRPPLRVFNGDQFLSRASHLYYFL